MWLPGVVFGCSLCNGWSMKLCVMSLRVLVSSVVSFLLISTFVVAPPSSAVSGPVCPADVLATTERLNQVSGLDFYVEADLVIPEITWSTSRMSVGVMQDYAGFMLAVKALKKRFKQSSYRKSWPYSKVYSKDGSTFVYDQQPGAVWAFRAGPDGKALVAGLPHERLKVRPGAPSGSDGVLLVRTVRRVGSFGPGVLVVCSYSGSVVVSAVFERRASVGSPPRFFLSWC